MLVALWYCCMEVRDYTLRAMYSMLVSIVLCCDTNSLAMSAVFTHIPFGAFMAFISVIVDVAVTLLCAIPVTTTIFPCEIAVFPLSFVFLFVFVIGPAMILSLLSSIYELRNS